MAGRFITLEGGEGAGKSTQSRLLAEWLRDQGYDIVETREPGGTAGAQAIRKILMNKDIALVPLAEAYLFAAARADHVQDRIIPSLDKGRWVVSDRFVDSSLAYQGGAGGLGIDVVAELNRRAIGDCWPDLTLWLRTDPETGTQRALDRDGADADRYSARNMAYHEQVAMAFETLSKTYESRFAIIDAEQSIDAVAAAIRHTVSQRLL